MNKAKILIYGFLVAFIFFKFLSLLNSLMIKDYEYGIQVNVYHINNKGREYVDSNFIFYKKSKNYVSYLNLKDRKELNNLLNILKKSCSSYKSSVYYGEDYKLVFDYSYGYRNFTIFQSNENGNSTIYISNLMKDINEISNIDDYNITEHKIKVYKNGIIRKFY